MLETSKTACELALAATSPSAAVKILKLLYSTYLLVDRQRDKRERERAEITVLQIRVDKNFNATTI